MLVLQGSQCLQNPGKPLSRVPEMQTNMDRQDSKACATAHLYEGLAPVPAQALTAVASPSPRPFVLRYSCSANSLILNYDHRLESYLK